MIIYQPLAISAVTASAGTGGANLATPDPKEIWQAQPGASPVNLDFDLGAVSSLDCILLGLVTNTNTPFSFTATGGATAGTITGTAIAAGVGLAHSRSATPLRRHLFVKAAAPVSVRHVRLALTVGAGAIYTAGIAAIGLAFQPTHNREWGGGRQVIDTGAREALLGGGFGIGEGARKSGYRWTFGDLTDAEVDALQALALARGETASIVVVEDPDATDGLNERIHYGLFDKFEAYERLNPQQTRWALSMTEWV